MAQIKSSFFTFNKKSIGKSVLENTTEDWTVINLGLSNHIGRSFVDRDSQLYDIFVQLIYLLSVSR